MNISYLDENVKRCLEEKAVFTDIKQSNTCFFDARYHEKYIENAKKLYKNRVHTPISQNSQIIEGFEFKLRDRYFVHSSDNFDIEISADLDLDNVKTWLQGFNNNPKLIATRGVKSFISELPEYKNEQGRKDGENESKMIFQLGGYSAEDHLAAAYFRTNKITFPAMFKHFIKSVAVCEANNQLKHENIILHEMAHILATKMPQYKENLKSHVLAYKHLIREDVFSFSEHYIAKRIEEDWGTMLNLFEKSINNTHFASAYKKNEIVFFGEKVNVKHDRLERVNIVEELDKLTDYIADELLAESITAFLFNNIGEKRKEIPVLPEFIPKFKELCELLHHESELFNIDYKMPFSYRRKI